MTYKEKARLFGINNAETCFSDFFEHPEYHGSNFSWKGFPALVAGLAKATLCLSLPTKTKIRPELKQLCYKSCYNKARQLVKKNKLV